MRTRLHTEYLRNGWTSYWKMRIDQALAQGPAGVCVPYDLAVKYVRIGNADAAFPWLHKAIDNACVWDTFIRVDPKLDAIRADRRFEDLLVRVHQALH